LVVRRTFDNDWRFRVDELLRRGNIWLAFADERWPVLLISSENRGRIDAMRIVPPATQDLGEIAVEVPLGSDEGLQNEGVLRVVQARPDIINCNWLLTVTREDLIDWVGAVSSGKLSEVEKALRFGGLS
jgi:mRNA interferase MazF